MKKSKPKQRTNWKQRALLADERAKHCEHVIEVQNQAAKASELRMNRYIAIGAESVKRAQAAEKRLAEFKRSEYFVSNACVECGSKREEKYMNYVCYSAKCLRACADKLDPKLTHWQRFKSFLKHWYV